MLIYKKYLIKSFLLPFIVITFFLLSIAWITQSIKYLDLIISKGISIIKFGILIFYLLPSMLFIIIPISSLCTLLYIFSKLTREKEIYTLKGMGLNNTAIMQPFSMFAIIVTMISLILSYYIIPISYQNFKNLQFSLENISITKLIQENVFINKINGLTFYIDSKMNKSTYNDIFIFDNRDKKKNIAILAQTCEIINTENGIKLILKNGTQQEFKKINQSFSLMKFDTYAVNINLFKDNFANRKFDPSEKNIYELLTNKEKNLRYTAHANFRIIWPFLPITITLISLFIFLNNRNTIHSCWKANIYITLFNTLLLLIIIVSYNLSHNRKLFVLPMYLAALLPCIYVLIKKDKDTVLNN